MTRLEPTTAYKICNTCVMDTTVPDIEFDREGNCNYCKIHARLVSDYPQGEKGKADFERLVAEMKERGKRKAYDCIVGFSGGTDSTYLLYLLKEKGIRPLAVNLDNGWHSEIAVQNIRQTLKRLDIELRTHVIHWPEMRAVHLSLLKAGLPWPDGATDIAIMAILYQVAAEQGLSHALVGNDFRSEGKQPREWTYTDGKLVKYLTQRHTGIRLKSYPMLNASRLLYFSLVKRIKNVRPFWYLEYTKQQAEEYLKKELGWKPYGGHHHESVFTRFNIAYWLPKKFGIDKRKVTFSAQIRSGVLTREDALAALLGPACTEEQMRSDFEYVAKKLQISERELQQIFESENKSFRDYPSYYPLYQSLRKPAETILGWALPFKPMSFYEKPEVKA